MCISKNYTVGSQIMFDKNNYVEVSVTVKGEPLHKSLNAICNAILVGQYTKHSLHDAQVKCKGGK